MVYATSIGMRKWSKWIRRFLSIATIYAIGLAEAYYLPPRYGLEVFLVALGATAFLSGLWFRTRWYI